MFDIHSLVNKNRLYIKVQGKMDHSEMQTFIMNVTREIKKLYPGFSVVTDISEFEVIPEEIRKELEHYMKSQKELGLKHAVQIINPRAAMVSLQWQRSSWKAGYLAENVTTLQDAETKLDEMEQKTGKVMLSASL